MLGPKLQALFPRVYILTVYLHCSNYDDYYYHHPNSGSPPPSFSPIISAYPCSNSKPLRGTNPDLFIILFLCAMLQGHWLEATVLSLGLLFI